MDKIDRFLVWLMFLVLLGGIILTWIFYFNSLDQESEIVDCYDKLGNKMIGQECLDEHDDIRTPIILTVTFGSGLLIAINLLISFN